MKKLFSLILLLSFTIKAQEIKIGTQTWTTKNLDVSKFRNGEAIPLAKTNAEWELAGLNQQPAWCYYENKGENGTTYGKLYNGYAVNDPRGLAPSGYHIPTDAEWTILTDYLGGDSIAGAKMKSTSGWNSFDGTTPCKVCKDWTDGYREGKEACKACSNWTEDYRGGNTCKLCKDKKIVNGAKHTCLSCKNSKTLPAKIPGNGNNSSSFEGLPGGFRQENGNAIELGDAGNWWSIDRQYVHLIGEMVSRTNGPDNLPGQYLGDPRWASGWSWNPAEFGCSVRCLRD